jgi:predicted amidophosphoribosyltransferase
VTRALNEAIAKLAALPADEQDRFAQWVLAELEDERAWEKQFATSRSALRALASEALADEAAGRTSEIDPDRM